MILEGAEIRLPRRPGRWTVRRLIGAGGQGAVFELRSDADEILALKWYFPRSATPAQRAAIARLIDRGSPGDMFLWPEDIIDAGDGTFGYTMPFRPGAFRGMVDLFLGRTEATPSLVLAVGVQLADAFLRVHAEGLCYRDISFGNVFFDPDSGRVLVCDNDNVGVDGGSESGVLGTRRFMAPEVVLGNAVPSAQTDLHSLAVLIFYLVMFHHPLLGKREAEHRGRAGETFLLGGDPVFVFDPATDRNAPDPLTQPAPLARWPRFPPAVRELFVQAFGEGLSDPGRRVRESVWRATLARARDAIVVCPTCEEHNFAGLWSSCVNCHRLLPTPVRLATGATSVVLNRGTAITSHHVRRDWDLTTVLGRVVHDPARDAWGIRNESAASWEVRLPGRPPAEADPGRTIALVEGAEIRIGGAVLRVSGA
jgi:DNA-binding helix-hairpin-helix protein with protein kinase domain